MAFERGDFVAFDGLAVAGLVLELNKKLRGGRIDKIFAPHRDEISLGVRSAGTNYRLAASCGAEAPRVCLTERVAENPAVPPAFCMILRKHIQGSRIMDFYQPDFERVLVMEIESRDELGDLAVKRLFFEIMGRHSNIVLVDSHEKILGAAKNVGMLMSSVRQILPGLPYLQPPSQDKICPVDADISEFLTALSRHELSDKAILTGIRGISPIVARELSFGALGEVSCPLDDTTRSHLAHYIHGFFANIPFKTVSLSHTDDGRPFDFSAVPIAQYHNLMRISEYESLSEAIDNFYDERQTHGRRTQRGAETVKLVSGNISRCNRKIGNLEREFQESLDKDRFRETGDLIMANLHEIDPGARLAKVQNFQNGERVEIALKPNLTPSQNAQAYYSKYRKAKNAEIALREQLHLAREELEYLESVLAALEQAESEREVAEIRNELAGQGYIKRRSGRKTGKGTAPLPPLEFETPDGFAVFVGRNNMQNDELTLRSAGGRDVWFHVKDIPGAHVILRTNGREVGDKTIYAAAKICAEHSRAKTVTKAAVDYTLVKNVRKPRGAKPGRVVYEDYKTIIVNLRV